MKVLNYMPRFFMGFPMLVFATLHFISTDALAVRVPFGILPEFFVYITGIALYAAAGSILFRIKDEEATFWLGIMLLIFAFSIQLPEVIQGDLDSLPHLGKDSALGGSMIIISRFLKAQKRMLANKAFYWRDYLTKMKWKI